MPCIVFSSASESIPARHWKAMLFSTWDVENPFQIFQERTGSAPARKVIEIVHWAGRSTACVRLTKCCTGKTFEQSESPSVGEVYMRPWCFRLSIGTTASKANHQLRMYVYSFWSLHVGSPYFFTDSFGCGPLLWHAISSADLTPRHLTMSAAKTSEAHWTAWNKEKWPASAQLFVQTSSVCRLASSGDAACSLQRAIAAIGLRLNFEDISSQCVENPGTMHKCKTSGLENCQEATRNWTMTFVSD